ncbi:hypothetical protein [Sphingomonas lenta]|uniref:hypothetical protein n=1 Tax=Sphingomonas lenta TaxID=1141887 RepID=UPI001595409D|nr:hypothetical protein [Sphingomonas lenta]
MSAFIGHPELFEQDSQAGNLQQSRAVGSGSLSMFRSLQPAGTYHAWPHPSSP